MNTEKIRTTDPAKPPSAVHFLGNLLTFRARAAQTDGKFSVAECITAPGAGSPYHAQQDEESFLIQEGNVEFIIDGKAILLGPQEFIYIKPGTPHLFRNIGETPAKMLIINMPGGFHEAFFDAVGEPVSGETAQFPPQTDPDFAFIAEAAIRNGIALLPPPRSNDH